MMREIDTTEDRELMLDPSTWPTMNGARTMGVLCLKRLGREDLEPSDERFGSVLAVYVEGGWEMSFIAGHTPHAGPPSPEQLMRSVMGSPQGLVPLLLDAGWVVD